MALQVIGALALIIVVGAPAAASWHGLTTFGTTDLHLGSWSALVPLSLDGAAFYAAWLALRAVLVGDSAVWPRMLTLVYAIASSAANMYAAPSTAAGVFYGGMSLSAVILWDTTLRSLRRGQLRDSGLVEGPAARYRPLRWMFAPTETFSAVKLAVLENVSDPRVAISMVRGEPVETASKLDEVDPVLSEMGVPIDLSEVSTEELIEREAIAIGSKADAVRAAFGALGTADVPAVVGWLAERGVEVDRTYVYSLKRKANEIPAKAQRSIGGQR